MVKIRQARRINPDVKNDSKKTDGKSIIPITFFHKRAINASLLELVHKVEIVVVNIVLCPQKNIHYI